MRKLIIAGNWKMHKNVSQAVDFVEELAAKVANTSVEVVVCPPFTALFAVAEAIKGTKIVLGAQNVHWQEEGAYTGEIAPGMLAEIGCRYVIIGHSERRQYFDETDENVNKKVQAVLMHDMTPIICVGETLQEREQGITEQVVGNQIKAALAGLAGDVVANLVVAYEPIWAIGTGKTASEQDAQQVIASIRNTIKTLVGDGANQVRIQYGGSVKPDNTAGLMAQPDIDGALVGGASLAPEVFAGIVTRAREK